MALRRSAVDACPRCGRDMVLVGRVHRCVIAEEVEVREGGGWGGVQGKLESLRAEVARLKLDLAEANRKLEGVTAGDRKSGDRKSVELLSPPLLSPPKKELVSPPTGKRGRGRPRAAGERPWEAQGISRKTWYKRKGGG